MWEILISVHILLVTQVKYTKFYSTSEESCPRLLAVVKYVRNSKSIRKYKAFQKFGLVDYPSMTSTDQISLALYKN